MVRERWLAHSKNDYHPRQIASWATPLFSQHTVYRLQSPPIRPFADLVIWRFVDLRLHRLSNPLPIARNICRSGDLAIWRFDPTWTGASGYFDIGHSTFDIQTIWRSGYVVIWRFCSHRDWCLGILQHSAFDIGYSTFNPSLPHLQVEPGLAHRKPTLISSEIVA